MPAPTSILRSRSLATATVFTATVAALTAQSGPTFELISIRPVETNGKTVQQEVVDQTGLAGYYDFDIRWNAPAGATTPGLGPEGINLFLTELREQFGLRFTNSKAPLEYWIIDHIEPPAENP